MPVEHMMNRKGIDESMELSKVANRQAQQFSDRCDWDDGGVLGHKLNLTARLATIENLIGYLPDPPIEALQDTRAKGFDDQFP
jgi:hypothetical protein